jgi:CRP/FNR family transcriptional regulator
MDECTSNNTDIVMMTHEQIARHLGTAREVVTRMLKRFASDGIIEVTRKGIRIIDKKKLRDVAM